MCYFVENLQGYNIFAECLIWTKSNNMATSFNLNQYGIETETIYRNSSVPVLYELALELEKGTAISDVGALMT